VRGRPDAAAAAYLKTLPARLGRRGGQQIRLDDVVDVSEVARLRAVAVYLERPAANRPEDEAGNHRGVLRFGVLARAEDVEVAQPDRLDSVEPGPDGRILLPGRLRGAGRP